MQNLEKLKIEVDRKRESLKKAKAALKKVDNDQDKKIRDKVVKIMRTKLTTAEKAYKAAKPKGKIHEKVDRTAEAVKNTGKKFSLNRILTWGNIAVTTTVGVLTAGVAWFVYDYFKKDEEEIPAS